MALQPGRARPVAPSAIRPKARTYISAESGMVDIPEPRALETDEIPCIVEQFRQGAENAKTAGFDGVEIHAANGYLIDQFLRSGSNRRDDAYGGAVENRCRLALEIAEAVISVWGRARVGIRVSPTGSFNDMHDENPVETYGVLARGLNELGLAFIEVVEDLFQGIEADGHPEDVIDAIHARFDGRYIGNGGYTADEARSRISQGRCDAVTFGRPFIANPDLLNRFAQGAPLNDWDESTFYGGDARGYIDYPTLAQTRQRSA